MFDSISGTPSWRPMTDADLFQRAAELPTSSWQTFKESATETWVKNPGITPIRSAQIPPRAPAPDDPGGNPEMDAYMPPGTVDHTANRQAVLDTRREMGAITKEEYEASPSFRKAVPYDEGMTKDRAAAIAAWHDESEYRKSLIARGPNNAFGYIAAGAGMFLGAAFDPVNYVPIVSQAMRAAAVARFGTIGGATVAASADAATNTAIFGLLTRSERGSFGDDVSFQAALGDIAMAALVGAAFGGAVGGYQQWRSNRSLHALERAVEARRAVDDAVGDLVLGRDPDLSPQTVEFIKRIADDPRVQPLPPEGIGGPPTARLGVEGPESRVAPLTSDRITDEMVMVRARRDSPEVFTRVDDLDAKLTEERAHLARVADEQKALEGASPPRSLTDQRIAALEAELADPKYAGKRARTNKQAIALREELDRLREGSEMLRDKGAPLDLLIDREKIIRQRIADADMARARVGPEVKRALDEARAKLTDETAPPISPEAYDPASGMRVNYAKPRGRLAEETWRAKPIVVSASKIDPPDPKEVKAAATIGKRPKSAEEEFGITPARPEATTAAKPGITAKEAAKPTPVADTPASRIAARVEEFRKQAESPERPGAATRPIDDSPETLEFTQLQERGRLKDSEIADYAKAVEMEHQSIAYADGLVAAAICRMT